MKTILFLGLAVGIAAGSFYLGCNVQLDAANAQRVAEAQKTAAAKAYEQGRKDEALSAYWGAPTYQVAEKNGAVLVWRMEEGWTK